MKNSSRNKLLDYKGLNVFSLTVIVTVTAPIPAYAQSLLEEVIVTARKREETLQEVPVAVTAFSGAALQAAGILNMASLRDVVPNVDIQEGTGSTGGASIFIRGVGARNTGANFDSGVGIYLDGVYLSRPDGALLDNVDIQSVQVLRGPQGTLFGKNTTGGAVIYTTNKPVEEFEGSAEVRIGNFNRLDGKFTVNVPLIDNLVYSRLSLFSTTRDGFFENKLDGRDYSEVDRRGAQFQLRYLPAENLTVDLNVNYSEVDQLSRGQKCLTAIGVPGAGWQSVLQDDTVIIPATGKSILEHCQDSEALDRDELLADLQPNRYLAETTAAAITVDWEINDSFSFKSISAWRNTEASQSDDLDNTGIPLIVRTNFGFDIAEPRNTDQLSQEFQFNGTAFNDKVDYVIGAYGFWEKTDAGTAVGIQGPFFNVNFTPGLALYQSDATELKTENSAFAGFGQLDWAFAENWRLNVGLRYTKEKRELERNIFSPDIARLSTGQPVIDLSFVTSGLYVFPDGADSFNPNHGHIPSTSSTANRSNDVSNDDWTPMAGIQYLFEDAGFINSGAAYFRVASGFLSGGLTESLDLITLEIPAYKPEKVVNYELGLKFDTLDNTLRLNGALFYTDYKDRQLTSIRVNPDTGQIAGTVINADKATVLGLELESVWMPIKNLEIAFNATFTDGDIKKYDDIRLVIPGTFDGCVNVPSPGVDACPVDRSDEDLPRLPKESYYLALQYTWESPVGDIISRAQGAYRKGVENCFDSSSCKVGIYNGDQYQVNARFTWISLQSDWRVTLFGNNITDNRYIDGGTPLVDVTETASVLYNTPRTYGAELAYQW